MDANIVLELTYPLKKRRVEKTNKRLLESHEQSWFKGKTTVCLAGAFRQKEYLHIASGYTAGLYGIDVST